MKIGELACNLIAANPTLSNKEIVELVKAEIPKAGTTVACISWYRAKMKKDEKLGNAIKVEVQRTEEIVQAEIEECTAKLEMLEEELKEMKDRVEQEELEMLKKLLEKHGNKM